MRQFVVFAAAVLLLTGSRPSAELHPRMKTVYPRYREDASPREGKIIARNPAPLLWKSEGRGARYKIEMSRNEDFATVEIASDTIGWAMYSPHRALEKGTWYWRYHTVKSGEITLSPVYSFVIDSSSQVFETPSIEEFRRLCRADHPRLYVSGEQQARAFTRRNADSPEGRKIIARAGQLLSAPLPDDTPTQPRDTTGLVGFEMEMMLTFMYHLYGDKVKEPVETGVLAHLITGETKYLDMALRHALHLSTTDPKGHATGEDFNSASVMLAMAQAYDAGYDRLSPAQRRQLLEAICTRARHIYTHTLANRFEVHAFDNHIWQHVLRRFFMTSYAVLGDIPEADQWLGYCYEVWNCRFPIIGGTDGGAPDGNSYFPVNFETFIYMPFMFERFTGINFFDHPWYRNVGRYMLYSFPAHSISTQFGDEHEYMRSRPERYFGFIDAIARETGDPLMGWYLGQWLDGDFSRIHHDGMFALYRMQTDKELPASGSASPDGLPKAREFKDVGVVVMHTDLGTPKEDLMVSFISAPFGATGHAHANHNSFSVNLGGEALFGSSGYYSHFSDRHNLLHYRNSHGHNTILVDGLSQRIGEDGYGWIARFGQGEGFAYALGDATHAYGEVTSAFWLDRMRKVGVNPSREDGFGDPGVERFRRHIMLLEPSWIVIYDELEAGRPVRWTLMMHSPAELSPQKGIEPNSVSFIGSNPAGVSLTEVFSHVPIDLDITDRFNEPAVNWRSLTDKKTGEVLPFEPQWHAHVNNGAPQQTMRYLTVIRVEEGHNVALPRVGAKDGCFKVGRWTIRAELDGSKEPMLVVTDSAGNGVYYNAAEVGDYKSRLVRSTVIIDRERCDELSDTFPESMR